MKTTIDINDALLLKAKKLAAARQQTLKSVVESALREFLESGEPSKVPFKLRKHSFNGNGLQLHITPGDWAAIRERAYEGRGG